MTTVLVTGGAGFIGSHITDKLVDAGYKVVIADNYASVNSGYRNQKATYLKADILGDELDDIFDEYRPDYCIHLAANASVAISTQNPAYDATTNIVGSIKVVELCKKYGVKKIVAASSAAVYGVPESLPIDESHSIKVLSPYGLSKLTMENYIKLSGLPYVICRFANVYGERQTAEGEAGVVAIFNNAMRKKAQLFIDGDGEQTRDFVYVKDVAQACLNAVEKDIKNETINIGTTSACSINELFATMAELYGYELAPVYREAREGDIKHSLLDNNKYVKLSGVKVFTDIKDGLKALSKAN